MDILFIQFILYKDINTYACWYVFGEIQIFLYMSECVLLTLQLIIIQILRSGFTMRVIGVAEFLKLHADNIKKKIKQSE